MRTGGAAGARSGAPGARRPVVLVVLVVVAAALVAGCTLGAKRRPEPPEPALRLWTSGLVHWSGGRRDVGIALANGTNRPIRMEAPAARRARVVLFSDAGPDRVCGQDADGAGPPGQAVTLAPGEERGLRIDLARACGRIPPGEYRYEVAYEAPAVGPGPKVRPRPSYGHVVVEAGSPRLERGSLGAGGEGAEAGPRPGRAARTRR